MERILGQLGSARKIGFGKYVREISVLDIGGGRFGERCRLLEVAIPKLRRLERFRYVRRYMFCS